MTDSVKPSAPLELTAEVAETFYEIVAVMELALSDPDSPLTLIYEDEGGRGFLWEQARLWTEEFTRLHEHTNWGDGDGYFMDEVVSFTDCKILDLKSQVNPRAERMRLSKPNNETPAPQS